MKKNKNPNQRQPAVTFASLIFGALVLTTTLTAHGAQTEAEGAGFRQVRLQWEPSEEAAAYEVRVLDQPSDPGFPLILDVVSSESYPLALKPGTYYFQIRSIDRDQHPGGWSSLQKLELR